jgi:hypothetical protein
MPLIKKAGPTKGIGSDSTLHDEGDTNLLGGKATDSKQAHTPTMQAGVVLQGRYAIEGTLGVGGMSVVYRGRDLRFKDVVWCGPARSKRCSRARPTRTRAC